jgi:hypothetical protein
MFDLMGLIVTGGGILLSGLSLLGIFSNKDKIKFFELIFKTEEAIQREGKIFESFIEKFPSNSPNHSITQIMPRRMDCSSTGRDSFSSVYYLESGIPGAIAVATETEVKEWAYKTSVTATGVIITLIGFTLQIVKYVISL